MGAVKLVVVVVAIESWAGDVVGLVDDLALLSNRTGSRGRLGSNLTMFAIVCRCYAELCALHNILICPNSYINSG